MKAMASTTVEWPMAKKKPTPTGLRPRCIISLVVSSMAAMWSASKACRMPRV